MIKLRGTWTQIDPTETNWQCEYGTDRWDLSCGTCTLSPDKSSTSKRMNRAHWRNVADTSYLCSVHYDMLTYKPPEAPPVEFLSADEFASAFDTK